MLSLATFSLPLSAQAPATSYTVTIWPVLSTGVPSSTPITPSVTYLAAVVPCGQPHLPASVAPIVNPTEARFDDPANTTLDCVINITKQVTDLVPGTYLAAWQLNSASGPSNYGALTDPFVRRLGPPNPPAHPRLR